MAKAALYKMSTSHLEVMHTMETQMYCIVYLTCKDQNNLFVSLNCGISHSFRTLDPTKEDYIEIKINLFRPQRFGTNQLIPRGQLGGGVSKASEPMLYSEDSCFTLKTQTYLVILKAQAVIVS